VCYRCCEVVSCCIAHDQLLDELYRAPSTKDKKSVLQKVLTTCSALEQKWIIRIVLKDLKIGLKHERVLKYYHPDAMEACVCGAACLRAA